MSGEEAGFEVVLKEDIDFFRKFTAEGGLGVVEFAQHAGACQQDGAAFFNDGSLGRGVAVVFQGVYPDFALEDVEFELVRMFV